MHRPQICAARESIFPDCLQPVIQRIVLPGKLREKNFGHRTAVRESEITDRCQFFCNVDRFQGRAVLEGIRTDGLHSRHPNAEQGRTVLESIIPQTCHRLRQHNTGDSRLALEGVCRDGRYSHSADGGRHDDRGIAATVSINCPIIEGKGAFIRVRGFRNRNRAADLFKHGSGGILHPQRNSVSARSNRRNHQSRLLTLCRIDLVFVAQHDPGILQRQFPACHVRRPGYRLSDDGILRGSSDSV